MKLLIHASTSAYKKFLKGNFNLTDFKSIIKKCLLNNNLEKANQSLVSTWKEFKNSLNKINENLEQMANKFSFQFFEVKF